MVSHRRCFQFQVTRTTTPVHKFVEKVQLTFLLEPLPELIFGKILPTYNKLELWSLRG